MQERFTQLFMVIDFDLPPFGMETKFLSEDIMIK